MNTQEFAAQRVGRMDNADDELRPVVRTALNDYVDFGEDWYEDLVEAASVLWLEIYEAETDRPTNDAALMNFQRTLRRTLKLTDRPVKPIDPAQVERITKWVSTMSVNAATYAAARGKSVRWVTMGDSHVRATHQAANGQTRTTSGRFNVGGYALRYPGDPVGPPEIWINCRCVLAPGRIAAMSAVTEELAVRVPDAIEDEEEVKVPREEEEEDDPKVDDDVEVPWHAVLAPEGVPTGDRRMFAEGSLSTRELPLPLLYQDATSEGHDGSVRVGVITDAWRDEASKQWRARGTFRNTELAQQVIDGIVDGSIKGGSVDIDDVEGEMSIDADKKEVAVVTQGRIAGYTLVAIPAFQEAYIALGEAFDDELSDEDKALLAACGCYDSVDPEDDLDEYEVNTEDEFRDVSTEARKRLAGEGKALPDGSFPIATLEDLRNAIQAIGRAKDPAKAKAHIKKRARALGHPDLIPEGWALDPWEEFEDSVLAAAGTHDGPGWITNPADTARLRRYWTKGVGAGKIRWGAPGDFNRCRRQLAKYVRNPEWLAGTCANMHKEALGFWPSTHRRLVRDHALVAAAPVVAPMFTIGEYRRITEGNKVIWNADYFRDPELTEETPIVVTDDGRVYGHIAVWNNCYLNGSDICTNPPTSKTDYAYFRTGVIETDEGKIRVGKLTFGTGHAALRASAGQALAHYDKPEAVRAYVVCGEDTYGIWFSGALRPDLTADQIDQFRAQGSISGDWRRIGGNLEMIACTAVNAPGFPLRRSLVAAAGGEQSTLVTPPVALVASASGVRTPLDVEQMAGIARAAAREVIAEQKREMKLATLAPFRQQMRAERIARVRAALPKEK